MAAQAPRYLLLLLFLLGQEGHTSAEVSDEEGTVYIIRHGEKTWFFGCLSAEGEARAKNLVHVFNGKPSTLHETFAAPKNIFAHWYRDGIDCERCNQTVKPISEAMHLTVDVSHGGENPGAGPGGGNKGAAAAMLEALKTSGGPVLAAWEHMNIKWLTEALGAPADLIPGWPHADYDSVFVLKFDSSWSE
eukprot:TRINITY_DN36018_c0_g1_i2.p1 TRINITY_DN36018_c0_g1~~TRINITY_DN36018_c0_g1_i2.p1  ORF type:complete len:190 (-),score=47.46 TRINITY_DN36018_c0_g1_i2:214-783(-)